MSGGSQHNPNGRQSQLGPGWSPLQVANFLARAPQVHMPSDRGVTWHTPTPPPHLYHVPAPSPPDPLQAMKSGSNSVYRHTGTPPELYRHTPTPPDKHLMRHTPSPGDVKAGAPISQAELYPHLGPGREKLRAEELLAYARVGVDLSLSGARANGSPGGCGGQLSVRDAPTINSLIARAAPRRVDALLERLQPAPPSPHSVIVHPRIAPTPSPPSSNEDSADSCGAPPGSKRKRKPERTLRVPAAPPPPLRAPAPPPPDPPAGPAGPALTITPKPVENGDTPHAKANGPEKPATPPPARRKTRSGSGETIADIAAMIADARPPSPPAPPPAPVSVDALKSVLASPDPKNAEESRQSPPAEEKSTAASMAPEASVAVTPAASVTVATDLTAAATVTAVASATVSTSAAAVTSASAATCTAAGTSAIVGPSATTMTSATAVTIVPAEANVPAPMSVTSVTATTESVTSQAASATATVASAPSAGTSAAAMVGSVTSAAGSMTSAAGSVTSATSSVTSAAGSVAAAGAGSALEAAAPRRRSARTSNSESANVPVDSPSEAKPAETEASEAPTAASFVEVENQLEKMFAGIEEEAPAADAAPALSAQTAKAKKRRKSAPTKGERKAARRSRGVSTDEGGRRKAARKDAAKSKRKDALRDAYDSGSNASSGRSRGPYVQIRGPCESPLSVAVVNAGAGEEEERRDFRNGLRGRGLHASTLGLRYDATTPDATWLCAFCQRGPHHAGLGDLFGPYPLDTDCEEYRALDEATRRRYTCEAGGAAGAEAWFHLACGLWAPGLVAAGARVWGLRAAVWGARAARCGGCGARGAALACAARACPAIAHLPCARAWRLQEHALRALCPAHADADPDRPT